jgi:multidrug transporter EmrE-like cation transporter
MFALKIYFMAKAYSLMPVGIANALYGAALILCSSFLGLMYYKETLNAYSATGIMCIVSGVALIQYNK